MSEQEFRHSIAYWVDSIQDKTTAEVEAILKAAEVVLRERDQLNLRLAETKQRLMAAQVMLEILKEVTEWEVDFRQPNHVYLMDGDKVHAYQKWGEGEIVVYPEPRRMNKRYRKFVKLKTNPFKDIV